MTMFVDGLPLRFWLYMAVVWLFVGMATGAAGCSPWQSGVAAMLVGWFILLLVAVFLKG